MGKTILVVDDDPGIVTLISTMVKRADYTTVPAYSGQEALDKHATMDIDLILLDLAMPDMNGAVVLEKIRQREESPDVPHTPVILLTAHVQSYFRDSAVAEQVDGTITKPIISAQKMLDEIAEALGENA